MDRTDTPAREFLTWVEDVPFMVRSRQRGALVSLSFEVADTDYTATWCDIPIAFDFPAAAVAAYGLEQWAQQIATIQHKAHQAERTYELRAAA